MFRSRAPFLLAQKEAQERRKITQAEISAETGIRQPTISAWFGYGDFLRLDAGVVEALVKYFGCEFHDLVELVIDESGNRKPGQRLAVAAA